MTAEYAKKAKQQARDYAMLSYGLRYKMKDGYSGEAEEEEQPKAPELQDTYSPKAVYPQAQQTVETVSVTLIRYYVRVRKITG